MTGTRSVAIRACAPQERISSSQPVGGGPQIAGNPNVADQNGLPDMPPGAGASANRHTTSCRFGMTRNPRRSMRLLRVRVRRSATLLKVAEARRRQIQATAISSIASITAGAIRYPACRHESMNAQVQRCVW